MVDGENIRRRVKKMPLGEHVVPTIYGYATVPEIAGASPVQPSYISAKCKGRSWLSMD